MAKSMPDAFWNGFSRTHHAPLQLSGVGLRDIEILVLEALANRDVLIHSVTEKIALCYPENAFLNDVEFKDTAVSH